MVKAGRADLWTIRADGRFAGLAATVNSSEIVLLDYFAVKKQLRGRGVGSEALKGLMDHYRDQGLFVEIESTFEDAENLRERQKRKRFYVNCGMEPMGTEADLFGVRMELLGVGAIWILSATAASTGITTVPGRRSMSGRCSHELGYQ